MSDFNQKPKAISKQEAKRKLREDNKSQAKRPRKEKPDPLLRDMPTQLSYRVENGIRYLKPYWSTYHSQTKGRWMGRTLVDVFQEEFLSYNPNYVIAALRLGRIFINGKQVTDLDHRLKGNESIVHIHHRHEHPILDQPIKVIADTDDMMVLNKPTSMPVHACGQYKVNTVLGLLWKLNGIRGLRVLHRLDRVTSGVLLFAKNLETDREIKSLIKSDSLKKEYVCKVGGKFPDGKQICEQSIDNLVITLGIQRVRTDGEGKPCKSTFQRIWYDPVEDASVLLCQIESGRTHQIRVHLQFLGYPIKGDTLYNTDSWGPQRGKNAEYGKSIEQLAEDLKNDHSCLNWHEYKDPEYDKRLQEIADNKDNTQMENWDPADFKFDERPEIDPICLFCHVQKRKPPIEHFSMPLHCYRYTSEKWAYTAELPKWAWPPPASAEIVTGLISEVENPPPVKVIDFPDSTR